MPAKINDVPSLFPDDLKEYMDSAPEGSYTLLDVRQPVEYEEAHLPGAKLVPLPVLANSLKEIDAGKPVIVYCAVGGRSRMAAQLLINQGFEDVKQLMGGLNAWEEPTASGPVEFHLQFIRGGESVEEIIRIALHMEVGLKRFHEISLGNAEDEALSRLLKGLVAAEESHAHKLRVLLEETGDTSASGADAALPEGVMEGGIDIHEFMEQNESFLKTVRGYLDIAMMVETQALDLYLRMAQTNLNENARTVLLRIAEEEKAHLSLLGRYLDENARSWPER